MGSRRNRGAFLLTALLGWTIEQNDIRLGKGLSGVRLAPFYSQTGLPRGWLMNTMLKPVALLSTFDSPY